MRKSFKYRLYPTKKQEQKLFWTLTRCRELYNAALAERKEAYRLAGKNITYRMQANDLPEIKGDPRGVPGDSLSGAPRCPQTSR